MTLRPYQEAALEAIKTSSVARGIVAHATGTGKGHWCPHIPEALGVDRGVVYLVHRRELAAQMAQHLARVHGPDSVAIEQAGERARVGVPFVVASGPTLMARDGLRGKALADRGVTAVVADEAHHYLSRENLRLMELFGFVQNAGDYAHPTWEKVEAPEIPLIGLTATPARGDKVGLHNLFDDVLHRYGLEQAIRDGWLVPIRAFSVETETDLSAVRTRGKWGDFNEASLADAVNNERRTARIYKAYADHAKGLKTLVFCVDVAHAHAVADYFRAHGVDARSIWGADTGRAETLQWFRSTPGAVLTNCQLLTEGVDIPSVECVVMGRPTFSAVLYSQMLGRGTRLAPGAADYDESCRKGKSELLCLDVVDCLARTGRKAVSVMSIFGAPIPGAKLNGADVLKAVEAQVRSVTEEKEERARYAKSRAFDLFAKEKTPPYAKLTWHAYGEEGYLLTLPNRSAIRVVPNVLDQYVAEIAVLGDKRWARSETIAPKSDAQAIIQAVEAWVGRAVPEATRLLARDAGWKNAPTPASEKQLRFARRLGIPIPPGATKGEIATAIDSVMAKRRMA